MKKTYKFIIVIDRLYVTDTGTFQYPLEALSHPSGFIRLENGIYRISDILYAELV